jgi:nucleoside triphosphate diphosphatase
MIDPQQNQNMPAADSFARLQRIVSTLRGAGGCPWDIKQTPISLKKYLLEECHELAEAIDNNCDVNICEEIGDVFFILTTLIDMFAEQQRFNENDVFAAIIAKMIRRHPHVFSDSPLTNEHELRTQWEEIKALEKRSSPHKRP